MKHEAEKRFFPKISGYWSKHHQPNMSKAEKILAPEVSRFHCNLFETDIPKITDEYYLLRRLIVLAAVNLPLTILHRSQFLHWGRV